MGLLEKRRYRNFLIYASDYDENDPKTFKGKQSTEIIICVVVVSVYPYMYTVCQNFSHSYQVVKS